MNPTVLVTGGTGNLGSRVVPLLRQGRHGAHDGQHDGQGIRVLSRHGREPGDGVEYVAVDLRTGAGLDDALRDVRTVLHLAGGPRNDDLTTRVLIEAAKRAGTVKHFLLISVIGADAVPIGYFARKAAAERIVSDSGIPFSFLRAAQFHDLTLTTVKAMAKAPVLLAPGGVRWQPVDVRDVAARLAELASGTPAGRVPDLAGPRIYTLEQLQRDYLRAVGKHRLRLPVHVPGKAGKAYRSGANLSLGGNTGEGTWEEFLAAHVG